MFYLIILIATAIFFLLAMDVVLYLGDGAILSSSMPLLYSKYKDSGKMKNILDLKTNATKITGIIIILTNIIHQLVSILYTIPIMHYFGYKGLAYAGIFMGVFYSYFETFLKITSVEFPEQIVYNLSGVLHAIFVVFSPLSNLVESLIFLKLAIFGIKRKTCHDPVEEIQGAIDYHLTKVVNYDHAHIIRSAANLNTWSILEIMKHRKNLLTLSKDASLYDLLEVISENNQDYIPLWEDNEEKIIGYIDVNFLLKNLVLEHYYFDLKDDNKCSFKNQSLANYMQKPIFIYKRTTISKFLNIFNKEGVSQVFSTKYSMRPVMQEKLFFVVDEDGSFLGIVNRSNLSEALIKTTSYNDATNIKKYKAGYIVPGETKIQNINYIAGYNLDQSYITINNLFLNHYRSNSRKLNYIQFGKYKIILLSKPNSSKMYFYIEESKKD